MSKDKGKRIDVKKKPTMSLKEKRAEKRMKKVSQKVKL